MSIQTQLQVEKKMLEPPKPSKHEKSPPPKKLTSITTNAGNNIIKAKKTRNFSNNQNLIAKSKSMNHVPQKKDVDLKNSLELVNPSELLPASQPVNLLKSKRPPLEIHKIEGDKIVIIRRISRAQRINGDLKQNRISTLSRTSSNQVKFVCFLLIKFLH